MKLKKICTVGAEMARLVERVKQLAPEPRAINSSIGGGRECLEHDIAKAVAEEFGILEMRDDDPGDPEVGPMPDIVEFWPEWLDYVVRGVLDRMVYDEFGDMPPGARAAGIVDVGPGPRM